MGNGGECLNGLLVHGGNKSKRWMVRTSEWRFRGIRRVLENSTEFRLFGGFVVYGGNLRINLNFSK